MARPGTQEEIDVAHTAACVLYGANVGKVPDDVLRSLLERAPLFCKHGVKSEQDLRGFLKKSRAEMLAPLVGRSGYLLALPIAGTYVGAHVPSPATGLPIGATVMGTTINTIAMQEGLEAHYIQLLETTGLPRSVQRRYDRYKADALPDGVRSEVNRQIVRALVTLLPALKAMHDRQPMDQATVVRNDVYADSVTFFGAVPLDEGLQALGAGMKDVFKKVVHGGNALRQQGLEAPTHGELIAHQPVHLLEQRLINHKKGLRESSVDAITAMGRGVRTLWTEKFGRLLGVPPHAGFVIAGALVLTAHMLEQEQENANLPAGKITPRSALAVPGALMFMEFLATEAFGTLLGICDAMASRKPTQVHEEQDPIGRIEDFEEHGSEQQGAETTDIPPHPSSASSAAPEPLTTASAAPGGEPARDASGEARSRETT